MTTMTTTRTGQAPVDLGGGWMLWRTAVLRSAGMPFDWLDCLSDSGLSAADRVATLLAQPTFAEALAWQNPAMVDNWVRAYLDGGRLTRPGQREALLARYAQRYCAKNDTIGFFGPVAWADFTPDRDGLEVTGSLALRSHSVHLETWAVALVAGTWPADHQPVRPHPAVSVVDGVACRPLRPRVQLTDLGEALMAGAAGRVGADGIGTGPTAAELVAAVSSATGVTRAEVAAELERLVVDGLVLTGFPVPLDDRPERHVREALDAVADPAARQPMAADLDHLDRLRSELAAAVGDPVAVHAGLGALSGWIAGAAGSSRAADGTRNQGGRVAAYLDSRRDLDVTVGADLLDLLRDPLRVALGAARWLAAEVGAAVAEELGQRYAELAARGGPVRVSDLCFAAADTLSGAPGSAVHQVVEDYRLRWAELLATGSAGADGEVRLTVTEVAGLATALFPPVRPRWQAARCHSPDLMLDTSVEPPRWVLGELHVALNTTENRVFHTQCEQPELLAAGVARDMANGRVVALQPAGSPEVSSRTYPPLAVHAPGYLYWSPGADPGAPGGRSHPATGLVVREEGGRLVVSPAGGGWTASLVEVFGEFLSALVTDRFGVVDGAGYQPRIVLDGLVVRRESWRVAADALPAEPGQLDRLRAVLVERGLPRLVFARTPAERKPFLVDLDAPALLANLARAARVARATAGAPVDFSEMLPGPAGLWLRDPAGRRYTSEFRVVAVDPGQADPIDVPRGGP
jgi:hypothetical protein